MLRVASLIFLAFVLTAVLGLSVAALDLQADYFKAIGNYYGVVIADVEKMSQAGIADEELPVVFFVANRSCTAVKRVADLRLEGASWMDICRKRTMSSVDFYIIVTKPYTSKVFEPVLNKFEDTHRNDWKNIDLSDSEIVNLVNLRMMNSLHDYSVYEIMAMRDYGKSFLRINQQVRLARKKMDEQKNKVLEAR
jgi:hypothetical protein